MSAEFYVLDTATFGESRRTLSAFGPFPTRKAAENHIRKDCKETFLAADRELRDCAPDDWAAPMIIVQTVRAVTPCPIVSVKVELRSARKEAQ